MLRLRMYIDETGNDGLKNTYDNNNRFLSLTGVIMSESIARGFLKDALKNLKRRHFPKYRHDEIILHRRDIVNKRGPFAVLKDPYKEAKFNKDLLKLMTNLRYQVVTVVIDKHEHLLKYTIWRHHPYHYCLEILLERLCFFVKYNKGQADIMFEARAKKQDKKLKNSYIHYYNRGTSYFSPTEIKGLITSKEPHFKEKKANIAGLQIADMLAHPSCTAMRFAKFGEPNLGPFGKKVSNILDRFKYYRNKDGNVDGYGRKWLP